MASDYEFKVLEKTIGIVWGEKMENHSMLKKLVFRCHCWNTLTQVMTVDFNVAYIAHCVKSAGTSKIFSSLIFHTVIVVHHFHAEQKCVCVFRLCFFRSKGAISGGQSKFMDDLNKSYSSGVLTSDFDPHEFKCFIKWQIKNYFR